MKHIIRICYEQNLDLQKEVREFLKRRPKTQLTGIYKGN